MPKALHSNSGCSAFLYIKQAVTVVVGRQAVALAVAAHGAQVHQRAGAPPLHNHLHGVHLAQAGVGAVARMYVYVAADQALRTVVAAGGGRGRHSVATGKALETFVAMCKLFHE